MASSIYNQTMEQAAPDTQALATPDAATPEYLQIGEVAEQTGLTQRTLRYYEEMGLLDPPTRQTGNFRLYSPEDVARVREIVRLKQLLGFSLAEIKTIRDAQAQLSVLRSEYRSTPDARQRLDALNRSETLVRRQLELVEQKMAQMETMRAELVEKLQRYDTLRPGLMEALSAEGGTD
jgi:DNA-binding transcriptional MerR regulator